MKVIVIEDEHDFRSASLRAFDLLKNFGLTTMDVAEKITPMKMPVPPVYKNLDFEGSRKIRDKKNKFTTNRTPKKKKRKKK